MVIRTLITLSNGPLRSRAFVVYVRENHLIGQQFPRREQSHPVGLGWKLLFPYIVKIWTIRTFCERKIIFSYLISSSKEYLKEMRQI